jgi:hypothetical protein
VIFQADTARSSNIADERWKQWEYPSIEVGREKGVAGLSNHTRGSLCQRSSRSGSSVGPKICRIADALALFW